MSKKSKFIVAITAFFAFFLGRFSWNAPPWGVALHRKAVNRPGLFWGTVAGILALFILIGYGWHWYSNLPKPLLVTANITAPQITPNNETLVPDVLSIDFGIMENNTFVSKSVAPLDQINKDVSKNIVIDPAMQGSWMWQNDNRLVFTPSNDWLAGQTYTVHFNKNLFASGTKMEKMQYTFQTQPFQIHIDELKYYQDPTNAEARSAVATVSFNYPVDTASFDNNVRLSFQDEPRSFKFTTSFDEHKRIAYIHSEPLPLPKTPRYLQLTITKNVKSATGSAKAAEKVTQTILIPDASSYFKVSQVAGVIVRDEQDKPKQVITVETTLGVKEDQLNKGLHAYLLPVDYPATATEEAKTNYSWQNPGEVSAAILKLATPLTLQALPADRDYATLHSYQFSAETPRYIYLKIDKGISGFGNFTLTDDFAIVIPVPAFPKEIGFLHKGALLALSGEKKLSVTIRGIPAVKFQISRVLPDNLNQLITQTNGNFDNPHFINESFNQQNISEIFSDIQQFDTTDLAKTQYTALDLGKYLSAKTNTQGPQGLFLLQATGWDVAKNEPLEIKNNRLILITDLGLVVKDNSDGTHDVFVQSITKGNPVNNIVVTILGKNGLPILSRTTDVNGRVNFPNVKDFIEEREPTVYLAKIASDVAFIPFNKVDRQLNYSRYDVGGVINSDPDLKTLNAYVFSDRGLYRPGDTAHLGIIVKRAFAEPETPGLPLEVMILDPRGMTVKDQKFNLDAIGYSTLDFKTEPTSPTGQYTVNVFIVRDNHPANSLGFTTFRVAEFLPDRMRISSHFSPEQAKGWISPDKLTAEINLQNLYGAPAALRKVTGKILLAPQQVQFQEYPQYVFVDPLIDPNKPGKVFSDNLPDTQTDEQGNAHFDLNLARFGKGTYQLTFFGEGFEAEGGRGVGTQATVLVSPLQYLLGYKADGDLKYIKQNSERSVQFIAINSNLQQQAANNLRVQLIALHPVTTLVKKPDGTFQYQSIIQTNVLSTDPMLIPAAGLKFPLKTDQIGDFALKILDANNAELSQLKYSVVGSSELGLAKNAELTVKLNKTEYRQDEDIELQITAPYTGSGLITIERDKVYAVQWFKTSTTSSLQKIRIPKDFKGNGYVNVAFVRDWDSPEIFMSPLSYSINPFKMNNDAEAIRIDLSTPNIARPGENFPITYKSDKPGKIIVFAVDEGILQVANYKLPDPLGFFFQKRALEVVTQQTLDQILPKFLQERELSAVGGDGGEEELASNLNPFKRKTDQPVAFWSGIIDTDTTPRELHYLVPDYFNGTLRVMAVAVAADALGSQEKSSQIRGDFVINPNTPTFVAPGDEFEISASIANNIKNSGKDAKINIELKTSPQLEMIGASQQTLTIAEEKEQTVRFKLRAKALLGSANMTLIATYGDKISKMNSTLSVRPASAYRTNIVSGYSHLSQLSLNLDRALYPEFRDVEAVISSSPLILVAGLQRYLDNFPFGCTEQLTSKVFPLLAMGNSPWFAPDRQKIVEKIQATVQMLNQRQMTSGAFSYWPGVNENSSNPFASVYAMHFLTEAKQNGYEIPNDVFHAGISYLKDLASGNVTTLEEARIQAYAIYVLTRNEIVTTNYLTHLQLYLDKDPQNLWRQDIISTYMAATYQLLKNYADAEKLLNYFHPELKSETSTTDFYNNNIAVAQYLYLVARHFPDRLPTVGSKLVMPLVTAMNNDEINTIFSGYASLALSAYAQSSQLSQHEDFSITAVGTDGKSMTLPTTDTFYKKAKVDVLAQKIILNNPMQQNYFYQLTQSGFDKNLPTSVIKNNLEIFREYRDLKGNVITNTTLGSEIEVRIQIRSLQNDYLNNIAIVDLLPGGFEVVPDSINAPMVDYTDIREDRVVFFGSVTSEVKTIVYHIKATNRGHFVVPPIYAGSMYNPNIRAQGLSSIMEVRDPS